jgi:hypothetical protein
LVCRGERTEHPSTAATDHDHVVVFSYRFAHWDSYYKDWGLREIWNSRTH